MLRYLVAEKGILHRDVSWSNVLVNPEEYPERASNDEDQGGEYPKGSTMRTRWVWRDGGWSNRLWDWTRISIYFGYFQREQVSDVIFG